VKPQITQRPKLSGLNVMTRSSAKA